MKIRITKKGLPKAQWMLSQPGVPLQLTAPQQPNYAWTNFNTQSFPAFPQQQPQYLVNNQQGTPVVGQPPIVPLVKFNNRYVGKPGLYADDKKGFDLLKDWMNPDGDTSRKELKAYVNEFNDKYGTKLKLPLVGPRGAELANTVSSGITALTTLGTAVDYFSGDKKRKEWERFFREKMQEQAPSTEFEGIENINTGRMFENMLPKPNQGMAEYGGENTSEPMKIRITGTPDMMEYGGQANYGLDLGRKKVYTDMPKTKSESISSTVSSVPRDEANIEAEGGETVYGDLDGDGGNEHMKISGPRHTQGGVPLSVPEGSFIFSDTVKMKIKDPEVLKYFGLPAKKGGYTPAEIAKRYDLNKYKAILEDENTDELNKNTAHIMVKNYEKKLAYLAMVQESMKGFPQGMPAVAEQEAEKLAQAEYGGYLPKAQKGKENRVSVWDEEEQKALQEYIKQKYNVEIPINARDVDPKSQRFTLPSMQSSRGGKRIYGDEDWTSAENMADFAKRQKKFLAENPGWDPTKVGATEKFQRWYDAERVKKGMKPYFGKGQKFQAYDDMFGEYTFSAPDIEPTQPVEEKPKSFPGYFCKGLDANGVPVITAVEYKDEASRDAAGAAKDSKTAELQCPKTPPGEIPPPKTPPGKIPPKFLTPDKLAVAAATAIPPRLYLPYYSDVQFRPGQLAMEDWLSQAQNIQQTYNTAANTLGNYQPGTALASNLSFLAGQTGDQVSQAISQVGNRNVDRFNQFMGTETQRKQAIDAYNASVRDKRWEGYTVANQNFDNSRRKYINNVTRAVNNAWNNRMLLDLVNNVNPFFNVSPVSGLSYFKSGYGPQDLGRMGSGSRSSGANLSGYDGLPALKAELMKRGLSETNAENRALRMLEGSTTSYTDANMDGFADRMSTTQRGNPMSFISQLLPMYMAARATGAGAYGGGDTY